MAPGHSIAKSAAGWYRAGMAILGAHQSIAGGYYKAVESAHTLGCDCVQIFTHSASQWRSKPITAEEAARFSQRIERVGHRPSAGPRFVPHQPGQPRRALWRKSLEAMVQELLRAATLGIPYVVAHPGAYTTQQRSGRSGADHRGPR